LADTLNAAVSPAAAAFSHTSIEFTVRFWPLVRLTARGAGRAPVGCGIPPNRPAGTRAGAGDRPVAARTARPRMAELVVERPDSIVVESLNR
jgi:hypothetical protein